MNLLIRNLILLPLILLLIVIVIRFIVPMIRIRISGLITWKRSFRLAGLYLGALILLVPILYLLPNKDFIKLIDQKDLAIVQSENERYDFYNYLHLNTDKQRGIYKLSSQTFNVDTQKVSFLVNLPTYSGDYQVFVERKDSDDGVIEVSTYIAAQLVGGIDLSKLRLPLTVSFHNGTLSFMSVGHQKFDFRQFKPDFTIRQFNQQNLENLNRTSTNLSGQIIYIRVPKSLEIDEGKYNDQIQMLSST